MEIFMNGSYGTICDDGFGFYDAQVVCRQLGFNAAVRAFPGVSCEGRGRRWEGRGGRGREKEEEGGGGGEGEGGDACVHVCIHLACVQERSVGVYLVRRW